MKEEILKDFDKKFTTRNHRGIKTLNRIFVTNSKLDEPIDISVEDVVLKLHEYILEVHNNALKMVSDSLPDEDKRNGGDVWEGGFNSCREQVINNIQKLKI